MKIRKIFSCLVVLLLQQTAFAHEFYAFEEDITLTYTHILDSTKVILNNIPIEVRAADDAGNACLVLVKGRQYTCSGYIDSDSISVSLSPRELGSMLVALLKDQKMYEHATRLDQIIAKYTSSFNIKATFNHQLHDDTQPDAFHVSSLAIRNKRKL